MKEIVIKKDSWHYRFLDWLGCIDIYFKHDICSYTRTLLKNLILFSIFSIFVIAIAFGALNMIAHVLVGIPFLIIYGWDVLTPFGQASFILTGFLLVVSMFTGLYHLWRNRRIELEEKEPGFVKSAYRAHKERWCAKVKFD